MNQILVILFSLIGVIVATYVRNATGSLNGWQLAGALFCLAVFIVNVMDLFMHRKNK